MHTIYQAYPKHLFELGRIISDTNLSLLVEWERETRRHDVLTNRTIGHVMVTNRYLTQIGRSWSHLFDIRQSDIAAIKTDTTSFGSYKYTDGVKSR